MVVGSHQWAGEQIHKRWHAALREQGEVAGAAVVAWGVLVNSIREILLKSSIEQEYWGVSAVLAQGSIGW